MAPLVVLIAAAYTLSFEYRQTGRVIIPEVTQDRFAAIYREISNFMQTRVLNSDSSRERFVEFCGRIISSRDATYG